MKITTEQLEQFNTYGYIIIDDFLPKSKFEHLLYEVKNPTSYENQYQIRPNHYSHVFQSQIHTLPREIEPYIAKFSLLSHRPMMNILFTDHLIPVMKSVCSNIKYALQPGLLRLRSGDVFRAHQDGYAGIVGYSYFVNEGWCWDYGGILTYVRSEDISEMIYPKPNRLLLRNEKFKHFHFLNTIEQYCNKEQYIILGWADTKKGDESKVRGGYYEI